MPQEDKVTSRGHRAGKWKGRGLSTVSLAAKLVTRLHGLQPPGRTHRVTQIMYKTAGSCGSWGKPAWACSDLKDAVSTQIQSGIQFFFKAHWKSRCYVKPQKVCEPNQAKLKWGCSVSHYFIAITSGQKSGSRASCRKPPMTPQIPGYIQDNIHREVPSTDAVPRSVLTSLYACHLVSDIL